MSVRSDCLTTNEGALVSVSIAVQAKGLEALLDALANLDFPVNPAIYHDGALVTRLADGREEIAAITLVEFPAYSARLDEVRHALGVCGLTEEALQVTGMLEELQHDFAPPAIAEHIRVRHVAGRGIGAI